MCSNFYVHKEWCGFKELNDFWTEPEFQAGSKWVAAETKWSEVPLKNFMFWSCAHSKKFLLLLKERIRWQWNASSVLQCSKKNGLCVVEVTEQQTVLSEVHWHSEMVTEARDVIIPWWILVRCQFNFAPLLTETRCFM